MKIGRLAMRSLCLLGLWLGGMLTVQAQTRTVHSYYTDPQGTVLAKTDAQGNIIARYDYTPYGNPVASLGSPADGPGYTGHVNDPETGLVYMLARYYDPASGRFLSVDPVMLSPGSLFNFNRYAYANDNPIVNTDPDGRCVDGLNCATMLRAHVKWRMTHPNAPADGLEKAAFVGVGMMAGATLASISPELGAAAKSVIRKVLLRAGRASRKHSIPENRAKHIFRDKEGHLKDTPENREALQRVANDPKTTMGTDKYGNTWSSEQNKDGSQTWTQTRNGEIINGGINQAPRQYDSETGLSRPVRPDKEDK